MTSAEVRQRKPPTAPEASELQKHSSKPATEPRLKHGIPMQVLRSLLLSAWFNCCCVVIFATQVIGSPLYLINKDWYYSYMAYTKQNFGLVITAFTEWASPTLFRVSGDASVREQLHLSEDGVLRTQFPERLVLIANHQVYTDWIYLWWLAYTNLMHGRVFIILKESLKYIPVVGQGMMFYGFIFMARKWLSDKPRLQHRLERLKTQRTDSKPDQPQYNPMWLLMFPEGTNLSINTKRRSDEYGQKQGLPSFKHQVLPRSTGLFFCLQQLRGTVDWVYDSTIAYEGPPYVMKAFSCLLGFDTNDRGYRKGSYPDKYFTLRSTYLQGRPPTSVNMHWRRFPVSEIPLDDQKEFDAWLRARWAEKDELLDHYFETGRFPSELGGTIKASHASDEQKLAASAGYVESYVRLHHWVELGQIFMVLVGLAFLCRSVGSWLH
ncbi:Phospholipid/glycerol acyltransferase [Penicillium hispanicum]|uniref:Phospholipid/glycerol acyltransferase n=1 Tax=Penicillium hispanicum TaxID=1080232 RepID=UPI002540E487|nr:Phospholipid/glycerol acyltransferase [Penicillium hispanicum]KAJ5584055.1 Phospholipid/glycerol acyltransferase [Penicillium hispanicum]